MYVSKCNRSYAIAIYSVVIEHLECVLSDIQSTLFFHHCEVMSPSSSLTCLSSEKGKCIVSMCYNHACYL